MECRPVLRQTIAKFEDQRRLKVRKRKADPSVGLNEFVSL
jgi:hypothetical protein